MGPCASHTTTTGSRIRATPRSPFPCPNGRSRSARACARPSSKACCRKGRGAMRWPPRSGSRRRTAFVCWPGWERKWRGALTLCPEGDPPPVPQDGGNGRPLSDDEVVELLDTTRTPPFLADSEGGLRLSIAGAQSKLPVAVAEGRIAVPAPGQPTTHILKPPIPGLDATTENEAFAMRLATAMGPQCCAGGGEGGRRPSVSAGRTLRPAGRRRRNGAAAAPGGLFARRSGCHRHGNTPRTGDRGSPGASICSGRSVRVR